MRVLVKMNFLKQIYSLIKNLSIKAPEICTEEDTMDRMSIAFICGIPADEEKKLQIMQAELNRNPRRNKQIRLPIIDPANSDGSQSDEFCAPKESVERVKILKKKRYTKADQKAGEESFLFFARMHNPEQSLPVKRAKKICTFNIPSPVLLSESDD